MDLDKKNKLIDCCIDISSDFNISRAIYYILKFKYRYNGNNKIWEYYDNTNNKWYTDYKSNFFKKDIEILTSQSFL